MKEGLLLLAPSTSTIERGYPSWSCWCQLFWPSCQWSQQQKRRAVRARWRHGCLALLPWLWKKYRLASDFTIKTRRI